MSLDGRHDIDESDIIPWPLLALPCSSVKTGTRPVCLMPHLTSGTLSSSHGGCGRITSWRCSCGLLRTPSLPVCRLLDRPLLPAAAARGHPASIGEVAEGARPVHGVAGCRGQAEPPAPLLRSLPLPRLPPVGASDRAAPSMQVARAQMGSLQHCCANFAAMTLPSEFCRGLHNSVLQHVKKDCTCHPGHFDVSIT